MTELFIHEQRPHPDELEQLRSSIDQIDRALCELLATRFDLTQSVGEYKAKNGLPAVDSIREQQQFEKIAALAHQVGLNPEFAAKFLRLIIDEVIVNHKKIADKTAHS